MLTDDTREELPTTPEGILEYVRRTNGNQKHTGNNGTIANIRGIEKRANRGDESQRYETPDSVRYSDENTTSNTRGANEPTEQIRSINQQFTRGNGSTNQRDGTNTGSTRPTFTSSIKSTFKPFKDAFKREVGESEKKASKPKVKGKVLSDAEVIRLRPKIVEFVLWQSEHMDEAIQATTKGHQPVEIWSTIDADEAEIVVDYLMARGKVDPGIAHVVRQMSVFVERLKLGMIIGVRAYKTARVYMLRGLSLR